MSSLARKLRRKHGLPKGMDITKAAESVSQAIRQLQDFPPAVSPGPVLADFDRPSLSTMLKVEREANLRILMAVLPDKDEEELRRLSNVLHKEAEEYILALTSVQETSDEE